MAVQANIDDPMSGPDVGALKSIREKTGMGAAAAWLVMFLAVSGPCISSFQSTVVSPLGSTIASRFGGGNGGALVAQLSLTLPAIGVILAGPITAWLTRRFGYRNLTIGSAALLAIIGTAGAYIDNLYWFLATRFAVGLLSAIAYAVLVSLSGNLFRGATLGRMISYQNGLSAVFGMVLLMASGWTAHHFGWQASFFIYLFVGLFSVAALFCWFPPQPAPHAAGGARERVSLKPLLPIYLVTIGTFALVFMVIVQGSLLMSANGINDPQMQAPVIAASTITYALTATFCSWIEQHVTKGWTFTVALCFFAAGMLTLGTIPTWGGALAGSFMCGTGSGIAASFLTTWVIKNAPEGGRDQAIAWIAPTHYIGQLSNPIIMQYLRVTIGVQAAFILIGMVLCVAVVASAALHLRNSRRVPVAVV